MAGNSNLTVSVSADVTDLQAKLAMAQSAYTKNSAELRKLANEMRKAGDDTKAALLPGLQAASAAAAASRIEVGRLNTAFSEMIKPVEGASNAHKQMGGVIGQNRVAFNELGHSVRAVADGFAAGINPLTLFSEEFFRVSQAMTEFKTISVGAIAGWGAIAAAIMGAAGALVYWGTELNARRNDANDIAAILHAQNIDVGQDAIAGAMEHLRDFGNVNEAAAKKVISTFGQMHGTTVESVTAMSDIVPYFAKRLQVDIPEAAKTMAGALDDVRGEGAKFLASINASADVQNKFQAALSKMDGSAYKVVLGEITRQTTAYVEEHKAALAEINTPFIPASASPGNRAARTTPAAYSQGVQQAQVDKMIADLQASFAKLDKTPNTVGLEQFREQIERVNVAIGGTETSAQKDLVALRMWTQAVDSGKLVGDELTQARKAQAAARLAVQNNESSEELEIIRTNALKAASAAGADRAQELAAQKAVLQEGLNDEKLTADAKLELRKQLAQLELRDVRAIGAATKKSAEEAYRDYVAGINDKLAADKDDYLAKILVINEWLAHARAAYREDSVQYKEAMRAKIEADEAWAKAIQASEEKTANIAKSMAEAQANLDKIGEKPDVGEFKASLNLVFDQGALNAKVAAEVAKLKAALDSDLAGVTADINLKIEAGDKQGAANDYKTATQDLLTYTQQVQALNEKAAQAVQQSWQKIVAPIGQAFDSILEAAINSHGKIALTVEKAAGEVLISYIKMGVQSVEHWAAMELQKTLLTSSGEAARAALQAPAESAQMAQLAASLSKFVTVESAKTGAVVAGVSTRTAAQVAGASAGRAADAAVNGPAVTAYAARAAAGAYAALSGIPIVGPVLAPIAATVAFGAVSAYEGLASAEGGWDRVAYDGQLAELHKNEMVLPASLAEGVRRMTAGGLNLPANSNARLGGTSSVVNNSGDTNHSFTLNHNQVVNNNGTGDSFADQNRAMRAANAHMYNTMRSWYGKGALKLAGR